MFTNYMNALDPTNYRTSNDNGLFMQPASSKTKTLQEQFTTLLVKQMQAQDPLEPQTNEQFVSQLATFSNLEQLSNLNKTMEGLVTGQQQLINSQSLALIGREIVADTNGALPLRAGGAPEMTIKFAEAPVLARVEIKDATGKLVRTIAMPNATAGLNKVTWDGKDDAGHDLPQGEYKFTAIGQDGQGNASTGQGYVGLLVDGVQVGSGGIQLVSGSQVVNFTNVLEIKMPQTP